ncbi:hypothetical protein Q8A67_008678 [Cirrhinus molitorella]|uniref:Uncharacterized protein n=1 Tax=Cirrhinus molitorella TaxID=172907 RepID=A0AA88PTC0_9TELE|nr:hypothetical protein Q8A67_008678 [Cirrhinus molitorella]
MLAKILKKRLCRTVGAVEVLTVGLHSPAHPRSVSRSCRGFAELAKTRRDAGTEINCRPWRTPTHTHLVLIGPPTDTQHSMVKVLLEGHAEAHITRFQPVMPAHITLYASTAEISFSIPFFSRSHPHGSGVLQGRCK